MVRVDSKTEGGLYNSSELSSNQQWQSSASMQWDNAHSAGDGCILTSAHPQWYLVYVGGGDGSEEHAGLAAQQRGGELGEGGDGAWRSHGGSDDGTPGSLGAAAAAGATRATGATGATGAGAKAGLAAGGAVGSRRATEAPLAAALPRGAARAAGGGAARAAGGGDWLCSDLHQCAGCQKQHEGQEGARWARQGTLHVENLHWIGGGGGTSAC